RRLLIAAFASLLAVPVIAPAAAQGTTKYRYWQDLSASGPFPGRISLAIAYEDRHGNGKFTPRYAAAYQLLTKVSCNPGGETDFGFGGNAASKYAYFAPAITNGRFDHRFENQFENPQLAPWKGDLNGTVLKRLKRGNRVIRTARVNGTFEVEDWDPYGLAGVRENCTSFGSYYSATPCKRWRSKRDRPRWYRKWKVPICSMDPW
ncbi:MAG TPA: hypothetical protein VLB79_02915, partial [Solirubrobacterales bacterium]|nr:hypothetical protein [Solirubrobacterales bacterium]